MRTSLQRFLGLGQQHLVVVDCKLWVRCRVLLLERYHKAMLDGEAVVFADQFDDGIHVLKADGLGHLAAHALDRCDLVNQFPGP